VAVTLPGPLVEVEVPEDTGARFLASLLVVAQAQRHRFRSPYQQRIRLLLVLVVQLIQAETIVRCPRSRLSLVVLVAGMGLYLLLVVRVVVVGAKLLRKLVRRVLLVRGLPVVTGTRTVTPLTRAAAVAVVAPLLAVMAQFQMVVLVALAFHLQ